MEYVTHNSIDPSIKEQVLVYLINIKIYFINVWAELSPKIELYLQEAGPYYEVFKMKSVVLFSRIMEYDFLLALLILIVSIGTINWTIWFIRRSHSIYYTPTKGEYKATTSVIIPIYREKEEVMIESLESILQNNPDEIILVFDSSEKILMAAIKKKFGNNNKIKFTVIDEPGKRPALAKGIRLATGEIVILVDSDTLWTGKDFLNNILSPFQDEDVGGVGTRQKVKVKESWAQKIIDWNLDLKYSDYVASDSLSGSILCLSGRTAAYRRKAVLPILDNLTNEHFLGHRCMGGDDTRLTTLVLMQGYKTVYQSNCLAKSDFHPSLWVYLKQKTRWSRNSFRAYLRAMFSAWPWKQKRWMYLISAYHTVFPGLTALIGLIFFAYALYVEAYLFAILWIAWTFVARAIKSYSHLKKNPWEIYLLPFITIYYYLLSFVKLYAFFTMTKETWSGSRGSYKIKEGKRI